MRFTTALVAGAFATFASAQSATVSLNPVQASQAACIEDCPLGDTKCQSYCISVPSPNEDQVNETTKCAAKCDQGDGSPSDTEKYAACQQKCIQDHYWNSENGTPRETGSGSGSDSSEKSAVETTVETTLARATGSVTTTVTDATVTNTASESGSSDEADSTNSADDSETSGTATGTAAQSTETDSGASALVGGVSVFALFAAALAL